MASRIPVTPISPAPRRVQKPHRKEDALGEVVHALRDEIGGTDDLRDDIGAREHS